ncbi:restriction endonuclease [Streptomyces sp. NPDC005485]|uniref:restriction endonuclease n=1 Tax=Streptomyces sp. NPDC005485 TaxID=3155591 RepID=UPI0033BAE5EE
MTRRRPPARRRGRRPSKRQQEAEARLLVWLTVAAVVVGLVVMAVAWLAAHRWVAVVAVVLAVPAGAALLRRRQERARRDEAELRGLRYALTQLDALHHQEFEQAIRELMRRDGCSDAARVGGRGDLGADVKATDPFGRRWVIQCKHRRDGERGSAVGSPDLQVLNGTARPVHQADIAVIVTNGRVTSPAQDFARQQRLHLVDRRLLAMWAAGSQPLWDLLGALPPPRRPSALS